jgi:hypothetical protein
MKTRISITIALLFVTAILQAQDFRQLITAMREDYEHANALQVVMEVSVYDSGELKKPYYQQLVDIKREGNNYWYQVENNEMLMNENYLIVVDKEARQISYSKRSIETEVELKKSYQFNLDSILTQYEKPQYLGKEEDADHYLIPEKKGPIKEVHFYIVPETRKVKEIAYRYREGQYATIRFIVFEKTIGFAADTFSESKYMTQVNETIVPSRFFKNYNLNYK